MRVITAESGKGTLAVIPAQCQPPRRRGAGIHVIKGLFLACEKNEDGCVMEKQAAVYILASQNNGTLYIGVTSNLIQRVWQRFNARSNLKSGTDNGK